MRADDEPLRAELQNDELTVVELEAQVRLLTTSASTSRKSRDSLTTLSHRKLSDTSLKNSASSSFISRTCDKFGKAKSENTPGELDSLNETSGAA
jgi:hypothetical protein